jgi:uncharacterized protein YdcH (DUF465 family)
MSVRLFKALLYKSSQIQQKIEDESRRLRPDSLRLLALKKLRLKIKDRLLHLIAQYDPARTSFPKLQPVKIERK